MLARRRAVRCGMTPPMMRSTGLLYCSTRRLGRATFVKTRVSMMPCWRISSRCLERRRSTRRRGMSSESTARGTSSRMCASRVQARLSQVSHSHSLPHMSHPSLPGVSHAIQPPPLPPKLAPNLADTEGKQLWQKVYADEPLLPQLVEKQKLGYRIPGIPMVHVWVKGSAYEKEFFRRLELGADM